MIDPATIAELRVYPPLGVARLGNAAGFPGLRDWAGNDRRYADVAAHSRADDGTGSEKLLGDFRLPSGEIKRQAARFRIYAHLNDGSAVEVTAADARIKWTVAVANLKAGWYEFNTPMDLAAHLTGDALRRNRELSGTQRRRRLDIVPSPRSRLRSQRRSRDLRRRPVLDVAGLSRRVVHRRRRSSDLSRRARGVAQLSSIGGTADLRQQRRLVRRCVRRSGACDSDLPRTAGESGNSWLRFGCAAELRAGPSRRRDGRRCRARGALAEGWLTRPAVTSFTQDVWPIFDRLTGLQWVNHGMFILHGYGSALDARDPAVIQRLASGGKPDKPWRQRLFQLFRDPAASGPLATATLPHIFGDGVDTQLGPSPDATGLLTLTPTQYQHLRRWADGAFAADWPGSAPPAKTFAQLSALEQVEHLKRAPLHDCLGGPFHPAIELTWVMRIPRLWSEAYRLKILEQQEPAHQDFGAALTPAQCVGVGGPYDGVARGCTDPLPRRAVADRSYLLQLLRRVHAIGVPLVTDLLGSARAGSGPGHGPLSARRRHCDRPARASASGAQASCPSLRLAARRPRLRLLRPPLEDG